MTDIKHTAPFKLRFTNDWDRRWTDENGSEFYFQNLGGFWGKNDTRRLIERTTRHIAEAREFATLEEAKETLLAAEAVRGWQVIDAAGNVVE